MVGNIHLLVGVVVSAALQTLFRLSSGESKYTVIMAISNSQGKESRIP